MKKIFLLFFLYFIWNNNYVFAGPTGCQLEDGKYCIVIDSTIDKMACYDTQNECLEAISNPPDCDPNSKNFKYFDCYDLNTNHTVKSVYQTPGHIINMIVNNMISIGGIVLLILIVYAGFLVVKGGNKGLEEAKNIVTLGIIGLIIMIAAYWIVSIISTVTGLKIPGIN